MTAPEITAGDDARVSRLSVEQAQCRVVFWPRLPSRLPALLSSERVVLNLSRGEKIHAHTYRTDIGLVSPALPGGTPARAQYGATPMADPATGETYHVEIGRLLLDSDARDLDHQRGAGDRRLADRLRQRISGSRRRSSGS